MITSEKPLVSIKTITYNHAPYIKDCIEGVLKQKTNFKIEHLISDDCSSDGTREIIEEYAKKYPDIIKNISPKENLGSRQNGIRIRTACTGKYQASCEGDDYWIDPNKLQKQVDFLEANPDFVGVFHNVGYVDERQIDSEVKPWRTYNRDVFTAKDTIRKLSLFHTSSYFFRNLDYKLDSISNKKITSGDMLLLGVVSKFGKLKLLDGIMSVYRRNDGGITSNETKIKYHKNRISLNKALNTYFDKRYKEQAKSIINYHKEEVLKLQSPRLFNLKKRFLD